MRTEEYLNQARHLDTQINSKLSQIESLSALATKCTATLTDMPGNKNNGTSKMEDTILKIITVIKLFYIENRTKLFKLIRFK